ncbi:hypothetical protein GS502_11045 [Rhodococcus hoagii]|nr:hypothetical protein [Prescottella equi]
MTAAVYNPAPPDASLFVYRLSSYHAQRVTHGGVTRDICIRSVDDTLGLPVVVGGVHWYPLLRPGTTLRNRHDVQWHAVFGETFRDRRQYTLTHDNGPACDPGWHLSLHPSSTGHGMFPAWQAARRRDAMSRFAVNLPTHLARP